MDLALRTPKVGASGFRNIVPLTRIERRAQRDKVALEKERLLKRTGLSAKLYRENAPKTADGLIVPEMSAAGFMSDADRFHTDVAGDERAARAASLVAAPPRRRDWYARVRTREGRRTIRRAPDVPRVAPARPPAATLRNIHVAAAAPPRLVRRGRRRRARAVLSRVVDARTIRNGATTGTSSAAPSTSASSSRTPSSARRGSKERSSAGRRSRPRKKRSRSTGTGSASTAKRRAKTTRPCPTTQ